MTRVEAPVVRPVVAFIVAAAATAWVAVLVFTPLLPLPLAIGSYAAGSVICHQIADRSFHLFGAQLPVCARCLGIYVGAAAAAIAVALHAVVAGASAATAVRTDVLTTRDDRLVLIAGALPVALTVGLELAGVWAPTNGTRALTGLWLGAAGGLVVTTALATVHYSRCTRPPNGSRRPPTPI